MIWNDTNLTLADALEMTEDNFYQDYRRTWGLDGNGPADGISHDDWLQIMRVYGLGEQVGQIAAKLVAKKGFGPGKFAEIANLSDEAKRHEEMLRRVREIAAAKGEDDLAHLIDRFLLMPSGPSDPRTREGVFENALQFTINDLFMPSLVRVSKRARQLAAVALKVENPRIQAYLSRVARCYCLDQGPEMAVMCRAVISAALEELVDDDAVLRVRFVAGGSRIGLEARIDTLESVDAISPACNRALRFLKKTGDEAVHNTPGLEPPIEEMLDALVTAVSGLPGQKV
jgi:hypothetical protein